MNGRLIVCISIACIFLLLLVVRSLNNRFLAGFYEQIQLKGNNVIYQQTPEDYQANAHVKISSGVGGNNDYQFELIFKGPKNKMWNWKWSYDEDEADQDILKFGVPKSMFEPYYPIDSVIQRRNRQMKNGLFKQDGRYIKPDLVRMVNYYREYLHPFATKAQESLGADASWRDYIEMLMKACQDIPYGVPPKYFNNRYIGGVFPPPQAFVNKFGDCDSKAVIFCASASFLKNTEIVLLYETGHVLPAVKGIPKAYDEFYEFQNEKYIMADTAGPGRNPFGFNTNPYQTINKVDKVIVQ